MYPPLAHHPRHSKTELRRSNLGKIFLVTALLAASAVAQTVTANFANRSTATHSIPSRMFGINTAALKNTSVLSQVRQAGISESRKMADIPQVYATSSPDWSEFDWGVSLAQSQGLHPLITLFQTPSWLQPSPNPCPSGLHDNAPPKDVNEWARIAASYVAHLDSKFRGVVQDYEIWNEPELQKSFCVADNQTSTRISTYLSLYAAAASAMKAQAQRDGVSIRIGGPTVSNFVLAKQWIPALVSDSATRPYVDFISYHMYLTGGSDILSGMTWGQLYSKTQSTAGGEVYDYLVDLDLVLKGLQPNAGTTPLYITEFNDNWVFAKDCCRNDPTFGPLWNTVSIVDFLNSVYAGAPHVPGKLFYFAGSAYPYFCIAGEWNSEMNCSTSSMSLYPQYYAYKLLASPSYLGLTNGGHMASSVSPVNTQSGLLATAFFTSTQDSVVVVNPTSTSYSSVRVVASNTGYSSAVGKKFLLNRSNPHITTSSQALTKITGGFEATISVPAYSTVAVTIAP